MAVIFCSVISISPTVASAADACPVYSSFGGQFPRPGFANTFTSDIASRPDARIGFTHTFSADDASVSISSKVSQRTNVFSQIFLNYYNIIGALNAARVTDPEYFERWKTFCINPNAIGKGTITINETGVIRYTKTFTEDLPVGSTDVGPDDLCNTNGDGDIDPGESCEAEVDRDVDSGSIRASDTNDYEYAYPNIRDIARRIPSILSQEIQYCTPGASATITCSTGYECVEIPEERRLFYRNIGTDTGLCTIPPDRLANAKLPFPANLLCTDEESALPQTILPGKVCYSQPSTNPTYTQRGYADPDVPVLSDPAVLPFLKTASIDAPTDQLQYDTEAAEVYFGNAFLDVLGHYSKTDAAWIKSLPAKDIFSISVGSGTTMTKSPYSSDKYTEKLGGYAEIANDARYMNAALLPAGAQVVTAGAHRAYFRAGNGYNGALFVNGKPYGHNIDVPQSRPAIDAAYDQIAVATVVAKNPDDKKGVFVTTTGAPNGPLGPLIKVAEGSFFAPPAVFIRSNGEKALFAHIGESYKYIPSINGVFSPLTAPRPVLNDSIQANTRTLPDQDEELRADVRFTMDRQDNVHILWRKFCGEEVCPSVIYSKLKFDSTNNLVTLVDEEPVPLSSGVVGLINSVPFTIQTDSVGNALIAARLGSNDNNKLVFLSRSPSGQWSGEELITGKIRNLNPDDSTEFQSFSTNAMPKIAAFQDALGIVRTYVIYSTYENNKISSSGDSTVQYTQMYTSERVGSLGSTGTWNPPLPVSDKLNLDWQTRIHDEGLDRYGNIAFTVQERASKYDVNTKLFDPGGVKMCILTVGGTSTTCGQNFDGSGIGYVIPPTESSDKKMHVINPNNNQEML
ncbi:MAG: hypothetical protein M3Q44_03075 [bacterium]|nr:hypothetical protein [bacterium]